MTVERLSWCFL